MQGTRCSHFYEIVNERSFVDHSRKILETLNSHGSEMIIIFSERCYYARSWNRVTSTRFSRSSIIARGLSRISGGEKREVANFRTGSLHFLLSSTRLKRIRSLLS